MFRVVVAFADMQDGGYIYNVGDGFPRAGININKKRLEELSSDRNRRGVALIEADSPTESSSKVKEDTEGDQADVNPSETVEVKKRPRRGQKKNARTDS